MEYLPSRIQRGTLAVNLSKNGIERVVKFDYMGAAEYEFGALNNSLERIMEEYSKYGYKKFTIRGKDILVFCKQDDLVKMPEILEKLANNEYYTKMGHRFNEYIKGEKNAPNFWWDILNHYMFFEYNETKFREFRNLMPFDATFTESHSTYFANINKKQFFFTVTHSQVENVPSDFVAVSGGQTYPQVYEWLTASNYKRIPNPYPVFDINIAKPIIIPMKHTDYNIIYERFGATFKGEKSKKFAIHLMKAFTSPNIKILAEPDEKYRMACSISGQPLITLDALQNLTEEERQKVIEYTNLVFTSSEKTEVEREYLEKILKGKSLAISGDSNALLSPLSVKVVRDFEAEQPVRYRTTTKAVLTTKAEVYEKILNMYNAPNSRGFILHLLRSFFPVNKSRYVMDSDVELICCITGIKLISKLGMLEVNMNIDASDIMKYLGDMIDGKQTEHPIAKALKGRMMGITCDDSERFLSPLAFAALTEFIQNKALENDKTIINILKDNAGISHNTTKETKPDYKNQIRKQVVKAETNSLGDLQVLKDLKKKFEDKN